MAVQNLLNMNLKRIIDIVTSHIRRELPELHTPQTVFEVSLEPELDLLYIRLDCEKDEGFGEPIGNYIHAFIRDKKVVAVEIAPLSKFLEAISEEQS